MSCFSSCFKPKPSGPASKPYQQRESIIGGAAGSKSNSKKSFTEDYTLGEKLGEGAFSTVREARNKKDEKYAVKIINKKGLSTDDNKGLQQEIGILKEIDHPHIIKLYDIYDELYKIYLVTEIMGGGELFDRIVKKEYYTEVEAREVCTITFQALQYCHNKQVAHRDLKPENLLLSSQHDDSDLKIADFGFAKKCPQKKCLLTQCGTPGYVAPEILNGIPYGTQADMWSLGVIMYILLAGYPPFNGSNQRELFRLIKKGRYEFHEQYWSDVSSDAKDLVSKLLIVDPEERLTPTQALNHKWFKTNQRSIVDNGHRLSLTQFKKFHAKQKVKQAVLAAIAMKKMQRFVGLGVDQTFGFTQFQGQLYGCDPMQSTDAVA